MLRVFSFPSCCTLKRHVFVAGIEIIVPYLVVQFSNTSSSGTFCHGDKYFVPLGVEALHVVIHKLDSQLIVEIKKGFACSTDLEIIIDCAIDLHSFQEPTVLVSFALPCRLAS